MNGVTPGSTFRPGQTIVVYVAQKTRVKTKSPAAAVRTSKPAKAASAGALSVLA